MKRFLILCATLVGLIVAAQYAPRNEVDRLQQHFRMVDRELVRRDVSALTEAQRAARLVLIEQLREYSAAGVFPHNHQFKDRRVPYFRDDHGTLCAMAYLLAHNGGAAIVERVANSANNAFMPELVEDPELVAWLDEHGLSAEEAARIQPAYGRATRRAGAREASSRHFAAR